MSIGIPGIIEIRTSITQEKGKEGRSLPKEKITI